MMHSRDTRQPRSAHASGPDRLTELFETVRRRTQDLAEPLSAEDQCIQSMPDVSPTKWHLAHTTWFFETFILKPHARGYREFHPDFNFLFNSYYEQVGPRHERPKRGLLSRPPLADVLAYRSHVDDAMTAFEGTGDAGRPELRELLELGCHHEQQHQELMLTDIKHVSCPAIRSSPPISRRARATPAGPSHGTGSSMPADWSRPATMATASPSTARARATRSGSSRSSLPAGR